MLLDNVLPYDPRDPDCAGNSSTHHTGQSCIETSCIEPAGTAWDSYRCAEHNAERIQRILKPHRDMDELDI